jgi:UDP-N-acetylmuramoyl-L-alanyl-D-glutamate--2,6-diaminopimelate ligase
VVVFGCGGDRDQGKRPIMGRIAETYADMCFVTSDNPRTEDPLAILQAILSGMHKNTHAAIVDRAQAIQIACRTLTAGDWLIVAGKGHEDYQIIGTTKHPFDDRKVVQEAFGC